MAGIDVGGGHGGKKSLNQEIPLIPFIDFLLCLISFLLITAVWTQMARIEANAQVPGPPKPDDTEPPPPEKILHVEIRGESMFQLSWKEGNAVINTIDVERKAVMVGEDITYPELATKIVEQWTSTGSHRTATDKKFDSAVLHTDNATPYAEIIAVMDAIYAPRREFTVGSETDSVSAFNVTFAVDN